jgi:predicted dehydrogenase
VHFFDQIRYVAGEIKSVTAQTAVLEPRRVMQNAAGETVHAIDCDADDTFSASIETERGVIGNLFASWAGHGGATRVGQGTVYYGTGGRVTGSEITREDRTSATIADLYRAGADPRLQHRQFPLGLDDSFALSQLDWLEAVRQRRPPETSGMEGLRDLAAAFAILESAHAGRRVEVAEVLEGGLRAFQQPIDKRFGL